MSPLSCKPLISKQFCTLCKRPIEEDYMLDHYRKFHPDYMKKTQRLGRDLSKAPYGRNTRRRQIRERLGLDSH